MAIEPSPQFDDVVVDPVASGKWNDNPKVADWANKEPISNEERVRNSANQLYAQRINLREPRLAAKENRVRNPRVGPRLIVDYRRRDSLGTDTV